LYRKINWLKIRDSGVTLFVAALALRILFFSVFHITMGDDDGSQLEIAHNLLSGRGYVSYRSDFPTPYYAFLPPLFPVLAAGATIVCGEHALLVLRLLASLCGALTCVLIARLGRHLMCHPRGSWAGWALAFYPGHIIWSTRLLAESYVMLSYTLALYLVLTASSQSKGIRFIAAGILCALSALGRGEFSLFVLVITGWLLWNYRSPTAVRWVACSFLGFTLGMAPWVIRNAMIFKRLVVTASNYGENFYFAHSPYYHFGGEAFALPADKALQMKGLDERQIEDLYVATGKEFIRAHPWLTLYTTLVNALVFWRPNLTPGYVSWPQNLLYTCFSFLLLSFFALGTRFIFTLRDARAWMLILSVIAYIFLIHLPFYMVVRFREAISPLLVLVAAFGYVRWAETTGRISSA